MTSASVLSSLAGMLASGGIEVVDCSGTLGPETPLLKLPPDFAKDTPPIKIHRISEYDKDGPFWAWNWLELGEHSGTHFDAPVHWITGKDRANNAVDTVPPADFIAPAVVIDISQQCAADPDYLRKKLKEFKTLNPPIVLTVSEDPLLINKYYYGHSVLLQQVRYYPMVQLFIVALFIIITIFSLQARNKSTQNQVWAGMAKETAHQLGTPVSSLQGWVEMLKEEKAHQQIATEIEKDVQRLRLVSDRFGKIGSIPQLEPHNVVTQVEEMVEYIRKRATGKVHLEVKKNKADMIAAVSPPLFDWVIENLLKNALDAMDGKGNITVDMHEEEKAIVIDVTDTGKGIVSQNINRVFKPGFTTKKRGWGLGLSLTKRIVQEYHKGKIRVYQSEVDKGTTMLVSFKKV